jgi:spore photoproduct lyase
VSRNFELRPHQNLYRYDLYSDSICFEPEYGASEVLSKTFAESKDKYLLYYTKSDNVDHLLDLPYKTHSIFYITLSTDTVSREIERDTPNTDERIEALRRCQEAGYRVRVGFSPIIPVKNWRQEATSTLERLFAKVDPENVRLWVVSMMTAAEVELLFDVNILDPEYVEAMRQAAPIMNTKHCAPFPTEVRAEIYSHYVDEIKRISPKTPVSLCTEELQQWEILGGRIGMSPKNQFCCCGGTSVPRRG